MAEKAKLDYLQVNTDLPPARTMSASMIEMITLLCSVMVEHTVADMLEKQNKSAEQPS